MNANKVVKNKVLLTKISEYFSKHPDRDSVIVKADLGEQKYFWRAVREDNTRFRITEVNTSTDNFIFETKNNTIQEMASTVFADLSKTFMDVTSMPYQHSNIENAKRVIKTKSMQLTQPDEQQKALTMLNNLDAMSSASHKSNVSQATNPMADKMEATQNESSLGKTKTGKNIRNLLTKDLGRKTQSGSYHLKTPASKHDKATRASNASVGKHLFSDYDANDHKDAFEAHGRQAAELAKKGKAGSAEHQNHIANQLLHQDLAKDMGEAKKSKKFVTGAPPTAKLTQENHPIDEKKKGEMDDEQFKDKEEEEDKGKSQQDVGLDSPDIETDIVDPAVQQSKEEKVFSARLAGQTIRSASVKTTNDGGEITLTLVTTSIPAVLKWDNSGHVTFTFKNICYLVHK